MKHHTCILPLFAALLCLGWAFGLFAQESPKDYLVVDLTTGKRRFSDVAPDLLDNTCRTTELWLRRIPAGEFVMGSPVGELGKFDNEPAHHVTITRDFYLGVFEVTQFQYELIAGSNPAHYPAPANPVEGVSYNDIRGTTPQKGAGWPRFGHAVDEDSFLGKLRERTGLEFDLPTEAQWEYACRAGTETAFNNGMDITNLIQDPALAEIGRYAFNTSDGRGGYARHTKVGSYQPNAFGIYDMHGNVYEWSLDWLGSLDETPAVDPVGGETGDIRVFRGGGWFEDYGEAQYCRAASRPYSYRGPYFRSSGCGFRLALDE